MSSDPAPSAPPDADQGSPASDQAYSPEEALGMLRERLAQLADYARYYLASRRDAVKLVVKRGIFFAIAGLLAVFALAALLVTAVVLICQGVAEGLSVLLGHRWAGDLLTGLILIGGIAAIAMIAYKIVGSRSHRLTMERYAELRQKQREQYGQDISSHSASGNGHGRS